MTQCELILQTVARLTGGDYDRTFTRSEIKKIIGGTRQYRRNHIDPTIQGMREDEPGGANNVGLRYKGALRRVSYGIYQLTPKGKALIQELGF